MKVIMEMKFNEEIHGRNNPLIPVTHFGIHVPPDLGRSKLRDSFVYGQTAEGDKCLYMSVFSFMEDLAKGYKSTAVDTLAVLFSHKKITSSSSFWEKVLIEKNSAIKGFISKWARDMENIPHEPADRPKKGKRSSTDTVIAYPDALSHFKSGENLLKFLREGTIDYPAAIPAVVLADGDYYPSNNTLVIYIEELKAKIREAWTTVDLSEDHESDWLGFTESQAIESLHD